MSRDWLVGSAEELAVSDGAELAVGVDTIGLAMDDTPRFGRQSFPDAA